ncbi:MAG: 5-(carboxyamino)imidazole ribonucleotide synthase [Gammaproteobacteria bacterium]
MKHTTVGIVGAGQLGRMLALAGTPLGLKFVFLDTNRDAPAAHLGEFIEGQFDDRDALEKLSAKVDVVTFDVENVPASALQPIAEHTPVWPSAHALHTAQDRMNEKTLFTELAIPTPKYIAASSLAELHDAANQCGFPCVVKARRLGYDGRGQRFLHSVDDVENAWKSLNSDALIIEEFVKFDFEVSLVIARNRDGDTAHYPLARNAHKNGILHISEAPYFDDNLSQQAIDYAHRLLENLNYVGVLTIEFFVRDGKLLANEIAPRVHNSGHWTIEGAYTSQFENHLRAILNWPLGNTNPRGHSTMVNFLGSMPEATACLKLPEMHFHSYGKSNRPSRKVGHGTIVAESREECNAALKQFETLYEPDL